MATLPPQLGHDWIPGTKVLLDANIHLQQANSQFNNFATPQKQEQKSHHCGGGGSSGARANHKENIITKLVVTVDPGIKIMVEICVTMTVNGRDSRIIVATTI